MKFVCVEREVPLSQVLWTRRIYLEVLPKFLISQIRPFHLNTCIYGTYFDLPLLSDRYYHFATNSFYCYQNNNYAIRNKSFIGQLCEQ